jgi:hypothetical protein
MSHIEHHLAPSGMTPGNEGFGVGLEDVGVHELEGR